jgi:hypothetical protein
LSKVQRHHDASSHAVVQSAERFCRSAARCIPLIVTNTPPAIGPMLASKHISTLAIAFGSV